jgi:hypothetical protein
VCVTESNATSSLVIATITAGGFRPADDARVFVTSLTFRTGDARYAWLNTLFGVLAGVLDTVALTAGGVYYRQPTIGALNPAGAKQND